MKQLAVLISLLLLSMAFSGCFSDPDDKSPEVVKDYFELSSGEREFLNDHDFVATDHGAYTNFRSAYSRLHNDHIPIFVTTDSVLHLYHVQFEDTLKNIEENFLYFNVMNISVAMVNASQEDYQNLEGDLKELAKHNLAFFSVAASLLDPGFQPSENVSDMVEKELRLIENHTGMGTSNIMPGNHREDYSQYLPRGHYTQSERLKRYFKAMMWYGRMGFYLKSGDETKMAIMNTVNLDRVASEDWEAVYEITSFYVGTADDLSYQHYLQGITAVFEELDSDYRELENATKLTDFQNLVKTFRQPKITSTLVWDFLNETEETMGFRVMGQRFIPDSFIFQNLVYKKVLAYQGDGKPFTKVDTLAGPVRGFPRGLDVFSVLGSETAHSILTREGDTLYKNYTEQRNRLRQEFSDYDTDIWEENLYWRWLDSLRQLTAEEDILGAPDFMKGSAWKTEKLNSGLGSWTELRHDTILYSKQSYGSFPASADEEPVFEEKGYVEPAPGCYTTLLELTRTTRDGLEERGYLTEKMDHNLSKMESLLERLLDIGSKELRSEKLTEADYSYIRDISKRMGDSTDKVPLVADVHTDTNSEKVLEEATGYLDFVLVKVKIGGETTICAGPIFSHYEFKHPMEDRLTDEKWREMLERADVPTRAPWVKEYMPGDP